MAKFLTTVGNSFYIEQIIINSSKKLTLVTPFLKLSQNLIERLSDAEKEGVRITLVYGKNELAKQEMRKLHSFKNMRIYFCKNLHAKCYHNESEMIITSMNLYEFSERNNREMGILIEKETDETIFKEAFKEIESIKNASVIEKEFDDTNSVESKIDFKLHPDYTEVHNFHLPVLYKVLGKKFPNNKFDFDSGILAEDFPFNGVRMEVYGVIVFHFNENINYDFLMKKNKEFFKKAFPTMRFYWNYYKLSIYGEKGVNYDFTDEGLMGKVDEYIQIIEYAYKNFNSTK